MSYPVVDVHTHVYLPRYTAELRARTTPPKISQCTIRARTEDRLFILDGEPSVGRPVGPQYWDRDEKLEFMRVHGIDISFVSPANPWLDFLPPTSAQSFARDLNNDLEQYCATSPSVPAFPGLKALYGFGLLPLVPGAESSAIIETIEQLRYLPHIRGVIVGTKGVGKGLDDCALSPVWDALQAAKLVVFIHPHYGVDGTSYGDTDNGHVLPLALGFPFETTLAITRLILAGVLDRFPDLRLLLAHSGGALPQLSSRLASCIKHDPVVANRLRHDARYYLGQLYFDAVAYGSEELTFVSQAISRASEFQSGEQTRDVKVGSTRLLFGTDHPFFPPLEANQKWPSVEDNMAAIRGMAGVDSETAHQINMLGSNALRLFDLLD